MDFYIDTTIKELHEMGAISVRTYNSLTAAKYVTLGDVLNNIKKPMDLLNLRNFGRKSYTEMEPILYQIIRGNKATVPDEKERWFAALGDTIVRIITEAYNEVTIGETEVKAYLRAAYPQPIDLHYLVMGNVETMLAVVEDYSIAENLEVRRLYKQFIELVASRMEYAREAENDVYAEYKRKSVSLATKMENFSYEQMSKYFLTPIASEYLEKAYQKQVATDLSVRARNFVAHFVPHFADLVKYADEPLAAYRNICPGQSMMKTLTELFQFNHKFKKEFDRVIKMSDEDIQVIFLKRDYPFLTNRQRQYVCEFTQTNGHAPLFFLMLQYLRLSENRSNKMYSLYHGIFDGKERTLNEVADAMSLSRERVRQIVSGTIEVQETALATNEGWDYYNDLLEQPFIYEKMAEYVQLKESEHLTVDFGVFASLISLKADFKTKEIANHIILVNSNNSDRKIAYCIDALTSIVNAKYSEDTYVPLDDIAMVIPEQQRPRVKELLRFIATEVFEVEITDDEKLYLPQNFIDITKELYDILSKRGEPMHVEEIFTEFKRRYPDYKYTDPLQIKHFLYGHPHIKAVGKTSRYALDNWEGVYFGSIRDLLVDLLSDSDLPLHIDNLFEGVSEHYPNTTKESVAATMEDEDLQRFVEFEGSYFGLTSREYPAGYVVASSVQRYRFEDRLQMFKDFVDAYHRFPAYNGSDKEASLMRWLYNATNGVLSITDDQMAKLEATTSRYDQLGYPRSATESEFLTNCQDVKEYIRRNHTLPSKSEASELYAWLRRSRDNYDSYTDKRRQYMTDLLNYVLSFGFSL